MRPQSERNTTTTPRRILYIDTATTPPPHDSAAFHQIRPSFLASLAHFLQRPQSLPFVLSLFLFLTWISIRMHRSHRYQQHLRFPPPLPDWTSEADMMANLARFSSAAAAAAVPSKVAKDSRGWLLDPISLARASGISGGAVNCASLHVGEIRPGKLRGNHRHHDCNETFVIWGALTKFRLENSNVADNGYAEVTIGADDIVVAASPCHKAHALVNIDPVRSTFFIGCQDSVINYNASSTDFNVWKDF